MLPPLHLGIGLPRSSQRHTSPQSPVSKQTEAPLFTGFQHSISKDLFFAGNGKKSANHTNAFADSRRAFKAMQESEADSELPNVLKVDSKSGTRVNKQRAATQESTIHSNRFQRDSRHKRSAPPHRGRSRKDPFKTLAGVDITELRKAQVSQVEMPLLFHSAYLPTNNMDSRPASASAGHAAVHPDFVPPDAHRRNLSANSDSWLFDEPAQDKVVHSIENWGGEEEKDPILFSNDESMAFDSEDDIQEVKASPPPWMDGAIGLYGMQEALTSALDEDLDRQARGERSPGLSPVPFSRKKPS